MIVKVPLVNCYGEKEGCAFSLSDCNDKIVHFKFVDYEGKVFDRFILKSDLKALTNVFK